MKNTNSGISNSAVLSGPTTVDQVKELRAHYAALEIEVRKVMDTSVRGVAAKREFDLALAELQSSRHWLGEALGALGEQSPYKA